MVSVATAAHGGFSSGPRGAPSAMPLAMLMEQETAPSEWAIGGGPAALDSGARGSAVVDAAALEVANPSAAAQPGLDLAARLAKPKAPRAKSRSKGGAAGGGSSAGAKSGKASSSRPAASATAATSANSATSAELPDRSSKPTAASAPSSKASGSLEDEEEWWQPMVRQSWQALQSRSGREAKAASGLDGTGVPSSSSSSSAPLLATASGKEPHPKSSKSAGLLGGWRSNKRKEGGRGGGEVEEEGEDASGAASSSAPGGRRMPETFTEMALFNCGMTGSNESWIKIVLDQFEAVIGAAVGPNLAYLELEANLLALRIHKGSTGKVVLDEFRVCMLVSLRSLLPALWSTEYEQAWTAFWDTLQAKLKASLELPPLYEEPVRRLVREELDKEAFRSLGMKVFDRLFQQIPDTENYFKQSNERLIFIVTRAVQMTAELYEDPAQMINSVQALGLRHIMFNVPSEYFEPFVLCLLLELELGNHSLTGVDGVGWALTQISAVMVKTIEEGSNPLIRAVLANNPKEVRKALGEYSRQDRAQACL